MAHHCGPLQFIDVIESETAQYSGVGLIGGNGPSEFKAGFGCMDRSHGAVALETKGRISHWAVDVEVKCQLLQGTRSVPF